MCWGSKDIVLSCLHSPCRGDLLHRGFPGPHPPHQPLCPPGHHGCPDRRPLRQRHNFDLPSHLVVAQGRVRVCAEFIIIFKSTLFFATTQHHLLPVGPPSPQPSGLRTQPGYAGPASSLAVTRFTQAGAGRGRLFSSCVLVSLQACTQPPPPRHPAPSWPKCRQRCDQEPHRGIP